MVDNDQNAAGEVSIEVVYVDEHLIELAAVVGADHWRGKATAYVVPPSIDGAGHIACHARLASGRVPTEHRREQVVQLAVEFEAEAWAVGQFGRQLAELARTGAGRASLTTVR